MIGAVRDAAIHITGFRKGRRFQPDGKGVRCQIDAYYKYFDGIEIAKRFQMIIFAKKRVIMAQTAMTIRMDNDLKVQFDALCDEFGMSTNTAFNIFARAVVRKRRIPFVIEAPAKEDVMDKGKAAFDELRRIAAENGLSGMSLEEINEEIRLAREGK